MLSVVRSVSVLAVRGSLIAAFVVCASRASAQTTFSLTNGLTPTVTPTVANLQSGGTNLGVTLPAGSVTLNISKCQKNSVCTLSVFSTAVPTAPGVRLAWSVAANAGTVPGGSTWGACSGGSGVVTSVATPIFSCTATGNGNNDRNGIVVTFSYPVSWNSTINGTHTTSGITFRLVSN